MPVFEVATAAQPAAIGPTSDAPRRASVFLSLTPNGGNLIMSQPHSWHVGIEPDARRL